MDFVIHGGPGTSPLQTLRDNCTRSVTAPGTHPFCSFRCDFEDTAQYRASAMNAKGELSAYASVVVKSRFAGLVSFTVYFKKIYSQVKKQLSKIAAFFSRIQGRA